VLLLYVSPSPAAAGVANLAAVCQHHLARR